MKDNNSIINEPQLLIDLHEEDPLTIEKLRQYKGLETITDEQALKIIHSLNAYCQIIARAAFKIPTAA